MPPEDEHTYDIDDPEAILAQLRGPHIRADLFTFWQRLPDTVPKRPYYFEWDNVAAIPVTTYEAWLRQLPKKTRENLRKSSRRGVEVKPTSFDDALVAGMVEIFNESRIRQGRRFTHFGKGFHDVKEEWSRDLDESEFLGAYLGSELVGFIKLLVGDARYARTSGTICKLAHRDKAPMNALIAEAVRRCADRQLPYLVYGKFSYGQKGEDSLSDFKRHNGFQRIDVPRYFVPVSRLGRLALALGLHKGIVEAFPSGLVRSLVDIRSRWYHRT